MIFRYSGSYNSGWQNDCGKFFFLLIYGSIVTNKEINSDEIIAYNKFAPYSFNMDSFITVILLNL